MGYGGGGNANNALRVSIDRFRDGSRITSKRVSGNISQSVHCDPSFPGRAESITFCTYAMPMATVRKDHQGALVGLVIEEGPTVTSGRHVSTMRSVLKSAGVRFGVLKDHRDLKSWYGDAFDVLELEVESDNVNSINKALARLEACADRVHVNLCLGVVSLDLSYGKAGLDVPCLKDSAYDYSLYKSEAVELLEYLRNQPIASTEFVINGSLRVNTAPVLGASKIYISSTQLNVCEGYSGVIHKRVDNWIHNLRVKQTPEGLRIPNIKVSNRSCNIRGNVCNDSLYTRAYGAAVSYHLSKSIAPYLQWRAEIFPVCKVKV